MSSDPDTPRRTVGRTPLMGLATLMERVFAGAGLGPLAQRLIDRASADPEDAEALLDLSSALYLANNPDLARATQEQALAIRRLYSLARPADPPGLRVLAIMAPGEPSANTPVDFLVENSDVALDLYYLVPGRPEAPPVDDYDRIFVAVGESDRNAPILREAEALLAGCACPVLNAPAHIARLSRDHVFAALHSAPGIVVPATARVGRHALEGIAARGPAAHPVVEGAGFPIVVRPVGSHAGRGLAKLDAPSALPEYLRTAPGDEFYAMPFVDYRGADGLFRKYRVVLIGGRPYACHMAISDHWMIHYLNAGMGESAAKRAEEARFFARFEEDFARRHHDALRTLGEGVALDYFGIDCGETATGELLIFEVDSALIVHALDPVDLYPYKPPQMRKVFDAFRALLGAG
ncbi:MAG TPA: RimK family alpha-L-glutamate ligase [Gammaproteobacteria bacterium]|nr:hypothetical protein BMS3Abin12_01475 [bacterium BMS3Abin12]HDK03038.1 RimK family alpha-L-glutamate ligase [Gammaproteobacteria bacterium]